MIQFLSKGGEELPVNLWGDASEISQSGTAKVRSVIRERRPWTNASPLTTNQSYLLPLLFLSRYAFETNENALVDSRVL